MVDHARKLALVPTFHRPSTRHDYPRVNGLNFEHETRGQIIHDEGFTDYTEEGWKFATDLAAMPLYKQSLIDIQKSLTEILAGNITPDIEKKLEAIKSSIDETFKEASVPDVVFHDQEDQDIFFNDITTVKIDQISITYESENATQATP